MLNQIIILDTETCNLQQSEKVLPGNNLVYNIGWCALEPATGAVKLERSYVVSEIFFGERQRMKSCYYAQKIPLYMDGMGGNYYKVRSFFEILNELYTYCRENKVVAICAHNARFDVDALNTTLRYLTGLDYIRALPADLEIWDSMKMANSVYGKRPTYRKWCEDNGYLTKHNPPRARLTAEILYRFISGVEDFEEEHTALSDVRIEKEIVMACYRSHKKIDRVLYPARG